MLLGFISLLLTVGQNLISNMCISQSLGATWHPCSKAEEDKMNNKEAEETGSETGGRKLLMLTDSGGSFRRILASGSGTDKCAAKV